MTNPKAVRTLNKQKNITHTGSMNPSVWWWLSSSSSSSHCSDSCFTIIYTVSSVNFFCYTHVRHLKMLTQDKRLIREGTRTHCITKWGGVRPLTGRSRQVSEAQCLFLTLRSICGAPLKSPSSSHLLHLLPQLPLQPVPGCWAHTIQLCRLREPTGQSAKGQL